MEKLSGLIIDPDDDFDGSVLRSIFGSLQEVPDQIKQAERISPDRRTSLPDDLFALVLRDGDVQLRKFACTNAGTTALNVLYFQKTAHKLPEEAQKVAAKNLCTACGWYGLTPPDELQKVALVPQAILMATTLPAGKERMSKGLTLAKAQGGKINPSLLGVK